MFVLATAGHVDHGKSTFLKSLTGMQVDRLSEEKKRGMTVDLGFLWLETSRGKVGIADVPGHQRFLKNMVCGATMADAFLFLVACDDGWMPQSEEHLNILKTFGVTKGIVLLSKTDLVSDTRIQEVKSFVKDRFKNAFGEFPQIAHFSSFDAASLPIIRKEIETLIVSLPVPRKDKEASYWVDRVFSPQGAGVVVTGTLREGALKAGEKIHVWPANKTGLIRALQVFHQDTPAADPNARVAIQVSQINLKDVHRGSLLTSVYPALSNRADVHLNFFGRPLTRNLKVKFYLGTLEIPCTLLPVTQNPNLARLKFDKKIPIRSGNSFLIRSSGGETLLAGGTILDSKGRLRSLSKVNEKLSEMVFGIDSYLEFETSLTQLLSLHELESSSIFSSSEIETALTALGYILVHNRFIHRDLLEATLKEFIQSAHSGKEIKTKDPLLQELIIHEGKKRGLWTTLGGKVVTKSPVLNEESQEFLNFIKKKSQVFSLEELHEIASDVATVTSLISSKKLIPLSTKYVIDADRYFAYAKQVENYIQKKGDATLSELKLLLNIESRRKAVLILERMDRDRITYLKDGTRRLLREG